MKLVAHSFINASGLHVNGTRQIDLTGEENFLKKAYSELNIDYPKFHKMDNLSKLAFLATELMNEVVSFPAEGEGMQLIFANQSSSKQTDMRFIDSYANQGSPSPSLFVYTLPNIVTGELCIRHKWYGENTFFIQPAFQSAQFIEQAELAFSKGNTQCLCAWVDAKWQGNEECFLFLIDHSEGLLKPTELLEIYKSYIHE